jgi:hypothetical protein
MRCRRLHIVASCVLSLWACEPGDGGRHLTASARGSRVEAQRCVSPRTDLTGWPSTPAKFTGMTIKLPPGSKSFGSQPQSDSEETWRANDVTVFYRVVAASTDAFVVLSNFEDYARCEDTVGDRAETIVSYYSERTVVPGEFVTAALALGNGRILRIHAIGSSKGQRDTLMAIIQSVRLGD